MTGIEARLCAALGARRFALAGAGQLGEMALALWPDTVAPPVLVLDSHRRGTLRGIPIEPLEGHVVDPAITYLISAFKIPGSEARAISEGLNQRDILTVYDLFDHYIPHTLSNGWRNLAPTRADFDRIARARRCFAEPESIRAFDAVAAWRYGRVLVDDFPLSPESGKYDLSVFGRAGCFYDQVYDCGSYDLGLVSSLAKAGVAFGSLVAFEPDPARRAACHAAADALDAFGTIVIDSHAVCDGSGQASFVASGLFSARLASRGAVPTQAITVPTCTLDAYHGARFGWRDGPGPRVLVKAHVEGAEPRVLAGARALLERTQADVLVNLSHDEASFLDIPCFFDALGGFDLFLRASSLFGEGLTLLARRR